MIAGLRVINHKTWFYQLSSGIQAILNLADRPYDEDTIKFQIAPILNAAGRLYNAGSSSVLKALLSEDDTQSLVFASKMKQINEERKRLVTHWLTIAAAAAEDKAKRPFLPFAVLACRREFWVSLPANWRNPFIVRRFSSPV